MNQTAYVHTEKWKKMQHESPTTRPLHTLPPNDFFYIKSVLTKSKKNEKDTYTDYNKKKIIEQLIEIYTVRKKPIYIHQNHKEFIKKLIGDTLSVEESQNQY